MNWESSQTFQNLKTAFAAEAMASMRYHYYATTARREKMVHLCAIRCNPGKPLFKAVAVFRGNIRSLLKLYRKIFVALFPRLPGKPGIELLLGFPFKRHSGGPGNLPCM